MQGEKPSALLSSIETYDGVNHAPAQLTTPEPLDLQRYLRTAVDAGVSCLTMEVSSQALKLQRIGGMKMETGVFLNISRDHISPLEHRNFEDYFQAKLKLFPIAGMSVSIWTPTMRPEYWLRLPVRSV